MEAVELKKIMEAYDRKLANTLHLNEASIEDIQRRQSHKSTQKMLRNRIFEVVAFSLFATLLGGYVAQNWSTTHLAISGIIVHLFALVALIGAIGQVFLLKQIDFSDPIVKTRKQIELVNAHGLLFLKLIFLSAPVWWSYAIVSIDIFLGFDLYVHLDPEFVTRYLIINFLLVIPIIWVNKKLSYKNLHIQWVNTTLKRLTAVKTMKALESLNDIDEFEK